MDTDQAKTEENELPNSVWPILIISVVVVVLLFVLSFSDDPEVKSGWIQGVLGVGGILAASVLALRGILAEIHGNQEGERRDRLVRAKREAYSQFIQSVAKLEWTLGTMWQDENPFDSGVNAESNAPLYQLHLFASIENIEIIVGAMEYYNSEMTKARDARIPLDNLLVEIKGSSKILETLRNEILVLTLKIAGIGSERAEPNDVARLAALRPIEKKAQEHLEGLVKKKLTIQISISNQVQQARVEFLWRISQITHRARMESELTGLSHLTGNPEFDPARYKAMMDQYRSRMLQLYGKTETKEK